MMRRLSHGPERTVQGPPASPLRQTGRRTGWAAAAATATAAAALPVWRVGIGWPIATLGLLALVAAARLDNIGGEAHGRPDRWWRAAAGLAGTALAGTAAIRAAGWLVATCLGAALLLGSYALIGGRTWRDLARAALALPATCLGGTAVALQRRRPRQVGPPGKGPPQVPSHRSRVGQAVPGPWWRAALGVASGIVLLLIFGSLLRAADPTFAGLLRVWTASLSLTEITRVACGFTLGLGGALGVARLLGPAPGLSATVAQPAAPGAGRGRKLATTDWAIPVAMLNVLFGVFVWVQLTTLFGGEEFVLSQGGPDYADYARGGFGQLAAVTVLALAVVTVLAYWASRRTWADRALLRALGGLLCALCLVIVASAIKRMGLYAQAYGFSVPRLVGLAGEVWLGIVILLIIAAGARLRAAWLPRAILASAVVTLVALAGINPEATMARTHIARLDQQWALDGSFLANLSADATAEIDTLPDPWRSCILSRVAGDLARPDPWYARNLGRERARAMLKRRPLVRTELSCPPGPQVLYPIR